MTERTVIPLTEIRDVEKGSFCGEGGIEKMSLFGAYFLSYSSSNMLYAMVII